MCSPSLAILTPSRGLVFARGLRAVVEDLEVSPFARWRLFLTHDLTMPACRLDLVEQLEAHEARTGRRFSHVLWWDDDQVPEPGPLARLHVALADAAPQAVLATGQTWLCRTRDDRRSLAVTSTYEEDGRTWLRACGLFYALCLREALEVVPPASVMTREMGEDWQWTQALVAARRRLALVPDVLVGHLRLDGFEAKGESPASGWNRTYSVVIEEQ